METQPGKEEAIKDSCSWGKNPLHSNPLHSTLHMTPNPCLHTSRGKYLNISPPACLIDSDNRKVYLQFHARQ